MESAVNIFINGIAGVFAGITFLYLAIRLNSAIAGRDVNKKE